MIDLFNATFADFEPFTLFFSGVVSVGLVDFACLAIKAIVNFLRTIFKKKEKQNEKVY